MSFFTGFEEDRYSSVFSPDDAKDLNYEPIRAQVQKSRLEDMKSADRDPVKIHGELMMRCRQRELLHMTVADYLRRRVLAQASLNQSLLPLGDEADGK